MSTTPLMIRIRPETKEILRKAADDQRRSMSSLVEQIVREQLTPKYANVNDRLTQMLGKR